MAADDEQLGVVPLDRVAEHVPGIAFHHLEHSDITNLRGSSYTACRWYRGLRLLVLI
jgi:hypothetical protein